MPLAGGPAPTRRCHPRSALLQWLAVLAAGAGIAIGVLLGTADAADDAPAERTLSQGRDLYTRNCAQCHGPQGQGASLGERPVPAIDDDPIALLRAVMAAGRMPPDEPAEAFDSGVRSEPLPAGERDAILAYVDEEFDLSGDVAPPPEGDPAPGQDLYATNCAACHGSTGGGGVAGRGALTPALTEYKPQTIADAVRTGPFAMPQFAEGQITDQEIGDIAAFLDTVHNEEFAPLWGHELGPVYASAFAAGLMAVVLIVALVIAGQPMWFPSDKKRGHGDRPSEEQDEQDEG